MVRIIKVNLDDDVYKELKILAIRRGKKVGELVSEILIEYINKVKEGSVG